MKKQIINIILGAALMVLIYSCQSTGLNQTGSEYMPDMAHSVAVEANTYNYYAFNTWDKESTMPLKDLAGPRDPVQGTVPRGYAGFSFADSTSKEEVMAMLTGQDGKSISVPINSKVPYYYEDTEEERTRAGAEITTNPFPITDKGLAVGKELYVTFCAVCHGTKGNFNDGIYESGIYPAAPANLINDEFVAASPGRYYHAIMYGKNVMGAYKDKMNYEERWQVIHYVRSLQAKEKDLEYSESVNTLNDYAIPFNAIAEVRTDAEPGVGPAQIGEVLETESHDDGSH